MHSRLICLPIIAATVASALVLVQGGYGAGHGDLDQVIWILGVPGVLLTSWAPRPLERHDLLLIVWWPATWNVVFWAAAAKAISRVRLERSVERRRLAVQKVAAGAYHHPDGYIVHAQHRTTSGVLISAPPVVHLPHDSTAAALGAAIRKVLAAYKEDVVHPTNWSDAGKLFLKVVGYRSWRALEAPAHSCWIDVDGTSIVITPLQNGGARGDQKGFQPFGAEPVVVPASGSDDQLGQALRAALAAAQ